MASENPEAHELGRRLTAARVQAGFELAVLAARVGVDEVALARFEAGDAPLGTGALTRIAHSLGVPPSGLLSVRFPAVAAPTAPEALLLGGGTASLGPRDQEWIVRGLARARAFAALGELLGTRAADGVFSGRPAAESHAYEDGYAAARAARALTPDPAAPILDLARLVEDTFGVYVLRVRFERNDVMAAAARSGTARLIALNTRVARLGAVRRALAHELGHHVRDLADDGAIIDAGLIDLEGAYSHEKPPAEQRADAFALMFLAPADGIAALVGKPHGLTDVAEARGITIRVRDAFGLGFTAAVRHLQNLGYFVKEIAEAVLALGGPENDLSGFESRALLDGLDRRVREATARELLSAGRRRELLGLSVYDER